MFLFLFSSKHLLDFTLTTFNNKWKDTPTCRDVTQPKLLYQLCSLHQHNPVLRFPSHHQILKPVEAVSSLLTAVVYDKKVEHWSMYVVRLCFIATIADKDEEHTGQQWFFFIKCQSDGSMFAIYFFHWTKGIFQWVKKNKKWQALKKSPNQTLMDWLPYICLLFSGLFKFMLFAGNNYYFTHSSETWLNKPVSQSCTIAKSGNFWCATEQSNSIGRKKFERLLQWLHCSCVRRKTKLWCFCCRKTETF